MGSPQPNPDWGTLPQPNSSPSLGTEALPENFFAQFDPKTIQGSSPIQPTNQGVGVQSQQKNFFAQFDPNPSDNQQAPNVGEAPGGSFLQSLWNATTTVLGLGIRNIPESLAGYKNPDTAAFMDNYYANSPEGDILNAIGHGAAQGWGAAPLTWGEETTNFLRRAGVFNDYVTNRNNGIKTFNEAFLRPLLSSAATALEAGIRGATALTEGFHAALVGEAERHPIPFGPLAAAVEAFPEGNLPGTLPPHPMAYLASDMARARAAGVLGTEAQWKGLEEVPLDETSPDYAEALRTQRDAIPPYDPDQPVVGAITPPSLPESTSPQATDAIAAGEAPKLEQGGLADVHAIARSINPQVVDQYDALQTRRDTFARWANELSAQREGRGAIDDRIQQIREQMQSATKSQRANLAGELEGLQNQRQTFAEQAARDRTIENLRQQMLDADNKMRDLLPERNAAYREAQARMPQSTEEATVAAPETPQEEMPPIVESQSEAPQEEPPLSVEPLPAAAHETAETQGTTTETPSVAGSETARPTIANIHDDAYQQLVAAGRTPEQADAEAAIVDASYRARAAAFEGAKGTAEQLYAQEAPQIKGGTIRGRPSGKTIVSDEGAKKIVLDFEKADPSTFVHEWGHHKLNELLSDAKDEAAPPALKADAETVRDWLGMREDMPTSAQHERFARAFERYLKEGVAPSQRLATIFGKFRQWLTDLYRTVKDRTVPINDDIRAVFDRMLSEPYERDIIAPEREDSLAEHHENLADAVTPEEAPKVADQVRQTTNQEVINAIEPTGTSVTAEQPFGAGTIPPWRRQPTSATERSGETVEQPVLAGVAGERGMEAGGNTAADQELGGHGTEGQPVAGTVTSDQEPGEVGPSGGEDSAQGNRVDEATAGKRPEQPAAAGSDIVERKDGKVANIRLDKINTTADMETALAELAKDNSGFMDARYGLRAYRQQMDIRNTRLLLRRATDEYMRTRDKARTDRTPEALFAYAQSSQRAALIFDHLSNLSADWAHAGHELNRVMDPLDKSKDVAAQVKDLTGKTLYQIQEEADAAQVFDTPEQAGKFASDSWSSKWKRVKSGILSYVINNLISGPLTHMAYVVANGNLAAFKASFSTGWAATSGSIFEAMAKAEAAAKGIPYEPIERVYWNEIGAQFWGAYMGVRQGLVPGWKAFKTGIPYMKGLEGAEGELGIGAMGVRQQAIPGRVGYVLETPSRAVSLIHTISYSMSYEQEIARLAYRDATQSGLKWNTPDFNAAVAEFTSNPPDWAMNAAHEEGINSTLMRKPKYGGFLQKAQAAVDADPTGFLRLNMPFMQIGANLLREGLLDMTPAALAYKQVRADIAAGGAARDIRLGKMAAGSMLGLTTIGLAAEGMITGGGPPGITEDARNQRRALEDNGWKPYSLKMGNLYIPYRKWLGALGPIVALSADFYESGRYLSHDDVGKAGAALALGFGEVVADETWMSGLANLVDAAQHWDSAPQEAERYLQNLATSFVPFSSALNQTARLVDPYQRTVQGILEPIVNRMPFGSESLEPQIGIWGTPIPSHTVVSPGYARNDPIDQRLDDLEIGVRKPERKINGVSLNEHEYRELSVLAGTNARLNLEILMGAGFQYLPKQYQRDMIRDNVNSAYNQAREVIKWKNPEKFVIGPMQTKEQKYAPNAR